jgi:transposase-like protein
MSNDANLSEKRPRRKFSDEFKRDAVNLVVVDGYSGNRHANGTHPLIEIGA